MKGFKYEVMLTEGAEHDLESLYDYVVQFDSPTNADHVLDQLMKAVERLAQSPERGSYPQELKLVGIKDFRQVMFKPYRVIYRVLENTVIIYAIADGRRDIQSLLSRRLLRTY